MPRIPACPLGRLGVLADRLALRQLVYSVPAHHAPSMPGPHTVVRCIVPHGTQGDYSFHRADFLPVDPFACNVKVNGLDPSLR